MEKQYYLGIDIGSVSTNVVLIDKNENIVDKIYLRTSGNPIKALIEGMKEIKKGIDQDICINGVGATGSGRKLASIIAGADIVKNEITTHAIAAQKLVPDVKTILEIGGQDSKIIFLKNGVIHDFAMNTVCAAGTGSFLDRQASRMEIAIEDFGQEALKSHLPVRIAGRCAVFAESDMIHKQQMGHSKKDIINGLCEALVRNYLSNLAKGKQINEPIAFQGGVAANVGIIRSFEKALGKKLIIPKYFDVMGAYGSALIAKLEYEKTGYSTNFQGFDITLNNYLAKSLECNDCSNLCEVIEVYSNNEVIARWGDRCGKWTALENKNQSTG